MAGLLSTPPEGATEGADEGGTEESSPADAPAAAAKTETVPLGRRSRAAHEREALVTQFDEFKAQVARDSEDMRKHLSERDRVIAQLRGNVEAMQSMATQRPQGTESDVDRLEREALEHLDKGDLTGFRRRERQIAAIEAEKILVDKYKLGQQPQDQRSNGIPPDVQIEVATQFGRFPKLAENQDRSLRAVGRKIQELVEDDGYPMNAATRAKAWEMVNAKFSAADKGKAGGYSQQYREALYGAPSSTRSPAGDNGEARVKLPANWKQWADGAGMKHDEYAKIYAEQHPEAVE